jgi:hypothetical protein
MNEISLKELQEYCNSEQNKILKTKIKEYFKDCSKERKRPRSQEKQNILNSFIRK